MMMWRRDVLALLLWILTMPAPTNISFATATDLGTLPASVTQTVDDAGTTYTVYYKVTAPSGVQVLGAWALGSADLTTYTPTMTPWNGPASSPTQILSISALNKPLQFPVTEATEYFLKIAPNAGNPTPAVLTLRVEAATQDDAQAGDLFVITDDVGQPSPVYRPSASYTIRRFVKDFPFDSTASDADNLADGTMLVTDETNTRLSVYSKFFTVVRADVVTVTLSAVALRANRTANVFYAAISSGATKTVKVIDPFGVITGTESVTGTGTTMRALCPNNNQTVLYWANTTFGANVQAWDLVAHSALPDLMAGSANHLVGDILALANGTFLICSSKLSATADCNVFRVNSSGTVLQTYAFGADYPSILPRIAYGSDPATSFWIWGHPTAKTSQFKQINISDGSTLTTLNEAEYEIGVYSDNATLTPTARFGNSNSCPFLVLTSSAAPPTTTTRYIRRLRQFQLPSSPDNHQMFCSRLELLLKAGIGLLPDGTGTPVRGEVPRVMCRISTDGGQTWLPERAVSAGERGKWKTRVRWLRNPRYRNAVIQLYVSDPVDWQWVGFSGDFVEGPS